MELKPLTQNQIYVLTSGKKHWSKKTQSDVDGSFNVPDKPIIGKRYHISWAFKGAQFVLKKIEGEYAYLDNPRNKRTTLFKCKVSELRNLRSKNDNYKYHWKN